MGKVSVEAINEQLEKQKLNELYRIRDKLNDLIIAKEKVIIKGNNPIGIFNRKVEEKTQKEVKKQNATKS